MPRKDTDSSGDGRVIPRLPKEEGDSKADYLKRVKNSGRGYKARFSITAKSAKRLAQAVEKVPTPAGISQLMPKSHPAVTLTKKMRTTMKTTVTKRAAEEEELRRKMR